MVFAIIFGVLTLSKIYRKQIHGLYKKMFKDDFDEVSKLAKTDRMQTARRT